MPIKPFSMATTISVVRLGGMAAFAVPVMLATVEPSYAGGSGNLSCVGSGRSFTCAAQWGAGGGGFPQVTYLPGPRDEREAAALAARERQWVDRCRPVIRQDAYGVGRYQYAAAGCEYGKSED